MTKRKPLITTDILVEAIDSVIGVKSDLVASETSLVDILRDCVTTEQGRKDLSAAVLPLCKTKAQRDSKNPDESSRFFVVRNTLNSHKKMGEDSGAWTIKTKFEGSQDGDGNMVTPPLLEAREAPAAKNWTKDDTQKELAKWLTKRGVDFTSVMASCSDERIRETIDDTLSVLVRKAAEAATDGDNSEKAEQQADNNADEAKQEAA
jgi:hypothetical protein